MTDRVRNTLKAEPWHSDDQFWSALFPFMFSDDRFDRASEEVGQVLRLAGVQRPERVLDMACGPGRHATVLARAGSVVTGVDRSPYLLEKAKRRSRELAVRVEWVADDMREFVRPKQFDVALCLFTSLGFFSDDRENERALVNIFTSLTAGGSLVVDVAGKEVLARRFEETSSRVVGDQVLVQRRQAIEDWTKIANRWLLIRSDGVLSFEFEHWVYSARELMGMLQKAGFGTVRAFGDFSGRPYDADAKRLVAVARKPGSG